MARQVFSIAVLPGAGTWTSDSILPDSGDNVVGIVFSDQSGSLVCQQSGDGGTNWDWVSAAVTVTGGTGKEFSFPVYGNAARLVYTNGATPQTVFRIHSRLSSVGARP